MTETVLNHQGMFPFSSGGTQYIRDFSGYGNHPTMLNFAGDDSEFINLAGGQGIYTNAINEQLSYGLDADFDFTVENLTFEAWLQPLAAGIDRPIFSKGLANTDGFLFQLSAANRLEFSTYQAAATQTTNSTAIALADGIRHQYVAVRSGASVRLFLDGKETPYNAVGVHINPVAPSARTALAFGFVGYSQRLLIAKRAMSSTEIWDRFIKISNA